MEDDLYDEFGNYIGEEESEDGSDQGFQTADAYLQNEEPEEEDVNDQQLMEVDEGTSNAVVLH